MKVDDVLWTDGTYAVIPAEVYNAEMVGQRRSGSRCLCGGTSPENRARSAQVDDVRESINIINCGHKMFVKVLQADLPPFGAAPTKQRYDAVRQREVPPPKVIPDWPLSCPRCGKPGSAVMLFSSFDCRHGCFKR